MGIFALFTLVTVGIGFSILSRVLPHVAPNYKRVQKDLKTLQTEMQTWLKEPLVPIGREELELFSINQLQQSIKKSFTVKARGVFATIYNEPVLAYSFKSYIASGVNSLLYARTAQHEYAYWLKGKEIQVLINNKLIGAFRENGVLYNEKNRPIARINYHQSEVAPIIVQDREVACLTKAQVRKGDILSPRAFQFVKPDITDEEEKILLALATLELVQRSIPKKAS
ncbi:MAG: hypothetical protein ACK4TA_10835 [Saprospiraceae bacterium]